MSKKVLLSVAAVALLAMTAFAGDYKYEDWPTGTYTYKATGEKEVVELIETIPVTIHIPYYVIINPQDTSIVLKQVGLEGAERFIFAGHAKIQSGDHAGDKPVIHTNFNATLSTGLVKLAAGDDISTGGMNPSVWTTSVDPTLIDALSPTELTITCRVTKVNLLAFVRCSTLHVADVLLYIIPR